MPYTSRVEPLDRPRSGVNRVTRALLIDGCFARPPSLPAERAVSIAATSERIPKSIEFLNHLELL